MTTKHTQDTDNKKDVEIWIDEKENFVTIIVNGETVLTIDKPNMVKIIRPPSYT